MKVKCFTTLIQLLLLKPKPKLLPALSLLQDMNQQPSSPPLSFSSLSSLSDFLRQRIPSDSLSSWGVTPGTKTLQNLWMEISNGESSLSLPICRNVDVAVHVKNSRGASLIESQQLLSDGTVKNRNRPLSEKMMHGESVQDAAARALREELGEAVRARLLMDTYKVTLDEEKKSHSYPGLRSRYVIHSVDAVLDHGIPDEGEFSTDEGGDENNEEADQNAGTVFVRKHFWKWSD